MHPHRQVSCDIRCLAVRAQKPSPIATRRIPMQSPRGPRGSMARTQRWRGCPSRACGKMYRCQGAGSSWNTGMNTKESAIVFISTPKAKKRLLTPWPSHCAYTTTIPQPPLLQMATPTPSTRTSLRDPATLDNCAACPDPAVFPPHRRSRVSSGKQCVPTSTPRRCDTNRLREARCGSGRARTYRKHPFGG